MKECNSCGKCCTKYGGQDLSVTDSELEMWEIFNPDIFAYTKDGEVWFDPTSGKPLDNCPWLVQEGEKTLCAIYQDRPNDCRTYPSLIREMLNDKCEMIEESDLGDIKKAQKRLDIIMVDSRR